MNMSDEGTKVDWTNKANLARESFKEVLASDQHEDGKAQRILTAMAFIAAAAGIIFAELSRARIGASLRFPFFITYGYLPVCFFAFVITMIIGTLFFLAALGPAFNIPAMWRKKDRPYPGSLLFSKLILQGKLEEWESHWEKSSVENLQVELAKNYVTEAYLLAEKVRFKVKMMRCGKIVYKLSLGFLGMLVSPIFTAVVSQVHSLAAWIFAAVLIQDLVERWKSPGGSLFSGSDLVLTLPELGAGVFLITIGIRSWFG
jgi:hypothetical protein